MMNTFLIFDTASTLRGVFDTATEAKNNLPSPDCSVVCALVLTTLGLDAACHDLVYLFRVEFEDGSAVWVKGFSLGCAVATACLSHGATDFTCAREYDLNDLTDGGAQPTVTRSNALIRGILQKLRDDSLDLCAYAIDVTEGYETTEELFEASPKHLSPRTMTAEELRKAIPEIWYNYLLFEATGATLSVMKLHSDCGKLTSPVETLLWTYAFGLWGGYDCRDPYTLYTLLTEGALDPFFSAYTEKRSTLMN